MTLNLANISLIKHRDTHIHTHTQPRNDKRNNINKIELIKILKCYSLKDRTQKQTRS